MKYTNKMGLPEPLFQAVCNDPYTKGDCDYSTTELIKPPRIVALERQHDAELEEDASDRIWSLIGQIGHTILERANPDEVAEHRFTAYLVGKKIGGQVDLLTKLAKLVDYKVTSQWAAKDGVKSDWEQQHNINAWLCRQNGIEVTGAEIVGIYRDWSVGEARRNRNYPQQQVQVFPVKLWHPSIQEAFIKARIEAHERAKTELPECTPLERWARGEKWAVMSRDSTSGKAIRLYDTLADAKDHAQDKPKYYVEHRPPVQVRCLDYCSCAQFCTQWQQLKKANEIKE